MSPNLRFGGMAMWGSFLVGIGCLAACTRDPMPLPDVPKQPQNSVEREAIAAAAPSLDWSYSGASGPERWASLSPEFAACAGHDQSPIDVPLDLLKKTDGAEHVTHAEKADALGAVKSWTPQFSPLPLEAKSDGRLVELSGAGAQGLAIDGHMAPLARIELHVPAEHKLGGVHADAELVLWMKDAKLGEVALSLLFRVGATNPALDDLIERLPTEDVYKPQLLGATLSLPALVPSQSPVFAYPGSLSYPPCSTGVSRLVVAKVGELSTQQLEKLKVAVPTASERPVQPLGERQVSLVQFSSQASSEEGSSNTPAAPATSKTSK